MFFVLFRVKDKRLVSEAFEVDPLYLKHENQGKMPDYRVSMSYLFQEEYVLCAKKYVLCSKKFAEIKIDTEK